ncbi:MAG TPA: HAD family hydrolase [Terriglobales bacterium]
MPLKAVFFDAGGTLVFPDRTATLAPLHERGIHPSDAQLFAAEREAKRALDEIATRSGKVDQQYWENYYSFLLRSLDLQDSALCAALVKAARTSSNWNQVLPGTKELLQRLSAKYKIGVISNSDGRIARVLSSCGLGECFASITDSGNVGHEKPARQIFEAALNSLEVRPDESLYVGDIYSVDYMGAQNAGMQALIMDVSGTYVGEGAPRIESLAELESRLTPVG